MALRTEKEKMLAGDLYDPADSDPQAEIEANHRWLVRYNAALGTQASRRRTLLLERLAAVGEGVVIRPPFHCDYGFNITLGSDVFLNFNCVILDVMRVIIGDKTQIGPASKSWPLTIHAMSRGERPASSLAGQFTSGAMSGSAAARSSCRV